MKYLLHLDTSGENAIVAVAGDGKLICFAQNEERRNHAAALNLMIDEMLAKAGISFTDLAAVVVCAGPGSYTGLRIGMATAKGLCFGLDIPLIADNKLTLLAWQAYSRHSEKYGWYIPILTAREKEFFTSVFDHDFNNVEPASHIVENQLNAILSGKEKIFIISSSFPAEMAEKYAENIYVVPEEPIDLHSWVFYSFDEYSCNKTVNLSTSEPFYLKQVYTHK